MKTTYRNLSNLKTEVIESEELLTQIQQQPKVFFEALEFNRPPIRVPWVFALIVSIIGLALVTSIIFIGIISITDPSETREGLKYAPIPEIFGVIASSCIAAIAGLLAPSPIRNENS